jgi:hypothetical protein
MTTEPHENMRRERDNLRRLVGEVLAYAELGKRYDGNGKAACIRIFNLITKYRDLHTK